MTVKDNQLQWFRVHAKLHHDFGVSAHVANFSNGCQAKPKRGPTLFQSIFSWWFVMPSTN